MIRLTQAGTDCDNAPLGPVWVATEHIAAVFRRGDVTVVYVPRFALEVRESVEEVIALIAKVKGGVVL